MTTRIGELLTEAAARLACVSDSPRLDAEVLLSHTLSQPRSYLFTHADEELTPDCAESFERILHRRLAGQPVAYLTGEREFWSLRLRVDSSTLIPRSETELLVEKALIRIPDDRPTRALELGTGSGAVALAICLERPMCNLVATDACADALSVARQNAARHGISNVAFAAGKWFEPLAQSGFDVIVTNPPYVGHDDPHLRHGDARFEPRRALAAGHDGLDAIRRIARNAGRYLKCGGWLLLEHGYDQADEVAALLSSNGFDSVCCYRDLAGRPRVTEAEKGNE